MITPIRTLLTLMAALFTVSLLPVTHAQDTETVERIGYYVATDDNGTQQVYQHLFSAGEARQITHAEADVLRYGVAYDGLSVAYISDGQLWLQPIHTEEAEALATIEATDGFGDPVYSPDGQYIAYTNNGVWLLDLATRETRQILENVSANTDGSNADKFRIYRPHQFVLDADGKATKLIVDVGVWEWNTVGVYDLATETLQEFETEEYVQVHTDLLPLSDGRVLLFGNNGVGGEFALHLAESLDDINIYTKVFEFSSLTDETLFAEQAVEIRPGIARIFGTALVSGGGYNVFYFDYDVEAQTAGEFALINLTEDTTHMIINGELSPDGMMVPFYINAVYNDFGGVSGEIQMRSFEVGAPLYETLAETAGQFHWQPQP